jgi:hypothetical protein
MNRSPAVFPFVLAKQFDEPFEVIAHYLIGDD